MAEHVLSRTQELDRPIDEVFGFFSDAANLEQITPPELNFRIVSEQPIDIKKGTLIDYQLRLRGIPIGWRTVISKWDPPNSFVDESLKGPYKQWIHLHRFTDIGGGRTRMEDVVRYRLPLEPLGDIAHWFVRRELDYIFDFRYRRVAEILESSANMVEDQKAIQSVGVLS